MHTHTDSLLALSRQQNPVVIIGGGPAGLSAAYELSNTGIRSTVVEGTNVVGGISRTVEYKGYLFDIGGHRFFTKVKLIRKMWEQILGEDFLSRPRMSRIFYKNKFFAYPLEPMNALQGLGLFESARCGLSFLRAQIFPSKPEEDFATWVSNRFGKRLFKIFFESYTEKVWGIPCSKLSAEWGAQRIKGLSLWSAVVNAFQSKKTTTHTTLIDKFHYPRKGPGMMWDKARAIIEKRGSRVEFDSPVEKIFWEPGRVTGIQAGGKYIRADHVISSMPIRDLIKSLDPEPPEETAKAADDFHYRDFLTVALVVKSKTLFPDNWIYVHDSSVKVGRIQNYKNWSPEMVPDQETTCLGLEYFCFEGDNLWNMKDEDLVAQGIRETAKLGLIEADQVVDGTVVRVPKAYPVYDEAYPRGVAAIKEFLKLVPNLQLVGRNGMHRYNNQDHSMLTGVLAARNLMGGQYDLWDVNADSEYHEEGIEADDFREIETTQPLVPTELVSR